MTGIELILAALGAGVGVGASDAAKTAVLDAYTELRDLLRRRVTGPNEALAAGPDDDGTWQAGLAEELREAGADTDEEVLEAARRVLAAADSASPGTHVEIHGDARGFQIGNHDVQHNTFS